MGQPFPTIITGNAFLDRIQANIAKAFASVSPSGVVVVNSNNFNVSVETSILTIPSNSISNPINIGLPNAVANPGMVFLFKKIDTSSKTLNFYSSSKNRQGQTQTVENSITYTTNASLANGWLFSDGNNWWLVN